MTRFGDFYGHPDYPERPMVRYGGEQEYARFVREPAIGGLGWPDPVLQDWLWEHGDHWPFVECYGHIDLERIEWRKESLPTARFLGMPTDQDAMGYLNGGAADPAKFAVMPPRVRHAWEATGTWFREPNVLDRRLVDGHDGFQLEEGRTRVGLLRRGWRSERLSPSAMRHGSEGNGQPRSASGNANPASTAPAGFNAAISAVWVDLANPGRGIGERLVEGVGRGSAPNTAYPTGRASWCDRY